MEDVPLSWQGCERSSLAYLKNWCAYPVMGFVMGHGAGHRRFLPLNPQPTDHVLLIPARAAGALSRPFHSRKQFGDRVLLPPCQLLSCGAGRTSCCDLGDGSC